MTRFIMLLIVLLIPVSLNGCLAEMINKRYMLNNTLVDAAYHLRLADVKKFIKMGADLDASNEYSKTPLKAAFLPYTYNKDKQLEVVKVLIEAGADVNYTGEWLDPATPLWRAIMADEVNIEAVKMLLNAGAKVRNQDKKEAKRRGRKEILRLIEHR